MCIRDSSININNDPDNPDSDDQVKLRWSSTQADSCNTSFSFGPVATSSPGVEIKEPENGNEITYTITCIGQGDTASDSLTVNNGLPPPTIKAIPDIVQLGGSSEIKSYPQGSKECTLNGPGVADELENPVENVHTIENIQASQTFTVKCPAGEDSVTVHVVPVFFEE